MKAGGVGAELWVLLGVKQKEDGVPPHALGGAGRTSSPSQDLARGCGKFPVRKQCLWTETLWNPDSSQSDHLKAKESHIKLFPPLPHRALGVSWGA